MNAGPGCIPALVDPLSSRAGPFRQATFGVNEKSGTPLLVSPLPCGEACPSVRNDLCSTTRWCCGECNDRACGLIA